MKKRAKLAARGSEATVEKDWQLETKEPEMGKMEGTRKELYYTINYLDKYTIGSRIIICRR